MSSQALEVRPEGGCAERRIGNDMEVSVVEIL